MFELLLLVFVIYVAYQVYLINRNQKHLNEQYEALRRERNADIRRESK